MHFSGDSTLILFLTFKHWLFWYHGTKGPTSFCTKTFWDFSRRSRDKDEKWMRQNELTRGPKYQNAGYCILQLFLIRILDSKMSKKHWWKNRSTETAVKYNNFDKNKWFCPRNFKIFNFNYFKNQARSIDSKYIS